MGRARYKNARSRQSVTIDSGNSNMGPKGCPPPHKCPPITDYKHLYLACLFLRGANPNETYNMRLVRIQGSTKPLVRLLQRYPTEAKITRFTISKEGGYWYVSVLVRHPQQFPKLTRRQKEGGTVGADIGIQHYLSFSDGSPTIQLPKLFRRNINRSKNLRKKLALTQKGSKRRKKLTATIQRVDHKLALQRRGFVHELTAELTRSYSLIGIEDLNVKGMTSSAKGTVEKPGTNVRAKSSLNRRMLEGVPAEFRRQLEYKTKRTGATLSIVDRFYPSSKTCSRCGWKNTQLSLRDRQFVCKNCGLSIDRDYNAALNIAAEAERKYRQSLEERESTGTS